jgi:hypothetical protein
MIVFGLVGALAILDRSFPSLRVKLMEKVPKLTRWILPAVFVGISLVFAVAWRETLPEKNKGTLEMRMVDQNLNQLGEANPTNHTVVFFMEIYNAGRPTIVRDWDLNVSRVDENEKTISFSGFCQRNLDVLLQQSNITNISFVNDYIFEKTRRIPISAGGMENGFIEFTILGPQEKWLRDSKTVYKVSIGDVYGNRYTSIFHWPPPEP